MKCPVDQTTLAISDRQGVEIDYCPTCRGVWLDRGELDKILERDSGGQSWNREANRWDRDDDDDDDRHEGDRSGGKKRKRSWFEMFDFD
jgi:uncharacterized protein